MMTRVLAIAGLLSACGDKEDPVNANCDEVTEIVTYDGEISTLFTTYCTRCHSSTASDRNGAPPGVNFDSFGAARASAERANRRIQAGSMPPVGASVSAADRCTFQAWVDQGTPEN